MPGAARSIRDLAKLLGKSHTAVARWPKDDRWPFPRKPPWSADVVEQIRTWSLRTLAPNPAAPAPASVPDATPLSAERSIKVAIGLEKLEASKLKNQTTRRELHSTQECQQRLVKIWIEWRTSLLNFADSLPLDPDAKEIVRGGLLALLRRVAGQPTDPPPAVSAVEPA